MSDSAIDMELRDVRGGLRTTSTALGSLLARITTLHVVTGAQALGSLISGLASLGREAARTAEGARVREALQHSRVAANGDALWSSLGTDAAWSSFPPSPVLEDLRNDVALLLAHDLEAVLTDLALVDPGEQIGPLREPQPAECLDLMVGLWAYATEIVAIVEDLAGQGSTRHVRLPDPVDLGGPVLR